VRHQPKHIALVVALTLIAFQDRGQAQSTPPFNPNAPDPLEDVQLDPDLGTSGDLGGVDDAVGQVDAITRDLDSAIQDQLEGLAETVNSATDDLLGGEIQQIQDAFGIIGSVQEAIGSITDLFDSIFNMNRLLDVFNFDFFDIFQNPLGGLSQDSNRIDISTGPLGLPDPKQVEAQIDNAKPSAFEEVSATKTGGNGSPVIKEDLITLFERDMTDEVAAQTALTEDGQTKLRENAETAKQALEASQKIAEDSEGQDVSQNILRNISTQLAAQQQTGTLNSIDAQLRARDDALRNKMLVDAVRELQGDRIQNRREDAAAYSDSLTQGAQLIMPGVGINPTGG
jgi:hypothetical protein